MLENPVCCQCGGPGVPLGQLGSLFHFRCRNCGFQFSEAVEETLVIEKKEECCYCGGNCPNEPFDSEDLCDDFTNDTDERSAQSHGRNCSYRHNGECDCGKADLET
jgi:hypothetical protein